MCQAVARVGTSAVQTLPGSFIYAHAAAIFAACRSLYVSVITTIRGYGDYLWVDVVERVDAMGSQVGWAGQD